MNLFKMSHDIYFNNFASKSTQKVKLWQTERQPLSLQAKRFVALCDNFSRRHIKVSNMERKLTSTPARWCVMPFGNSIELSPSFVGASLKKLFTLRRRIECWKVLSHPHEPRGKIRQFRKLSRNREKKHDTPIKINFIKQIFKSNPRSLLSSRLYLIPGANIIFLFHRR